VGLILADIPPLAAVIAKSAGIPCWMSSNFGWDFIYRAWGGEFIEFADWIIVSVSAIAYFVSLARADECLSSHYRRRFNWRDAPLLCGRAETSGV